MAKILDKIMHNGDEYDLLEGIPSGGTDGQFLGKVSGDTAWADAPVTSVNGSTGAVTVNDTKVASSAPTATEGTLWYDSANDKLKAYNGSSWDEIGGGITKVFTISGTSDLVNAQAAYDWWVNGGNPIIKYSANYYSIVNGMDTQLIFVQTLPSINPTVGYMRSQFNYVIVSASSGTVSTVTSIIHQIKLASSAPTSGNYHTITLVI